MRNLEGGPSNVQTYSKDASENVIIYRHDLVTVEADGAITAGGTPGSTRMLGAALNHGAALTATDHSVVWNPGALYEAQDNAVSAGVVAADMFAGANAEYNAGDTGTLISGHEINETGISATSAALDLKLIALYQNPDNAFGPNARIICKINLHLLNPEADSI
jgi:hypothetical protein